MKNILIVIMCFSIICLLGCNKEQIKCFNNVGEFDEILEESIKYDIRGKEECEKGHIPGFMCFESSNIDNLIENLKIVVKDKNKSIVLIGKDDDIDKIYKDLLKSGYKRLYYYEGGYDQYALDKGETFIPEEGCGC